MPTSARSRRPIIKAAPERMVWGSDWPHPTEKEKPNDATLFDLLAEWAPDDALARAHPRDQSGSTVRIREDGLR